MAKNGLKQANFNLIARQYESRLSMSSISHNSFAGSTSRRTLAVPVNSIA